ncbi:MAG: energy transducer TonB [Bacteroidia bacterium]|nr:energy transducer TonB [Bacteroidia bacterium]NNL32770.1 energy transducer TonB [Flavobacteriaceae bacterium]
MKYVLALSCLFLCLSSAAQETEATDLKEDQSKEVPFAVVEKVPIYSGCDASMSNVNLKKCMSDKIIELVQKKFNTDLANSLGLPDGKARIMVSFKIDTNGKVVEIMSRAPHPRLEEEAIRVIQLIPSMDAPGYAHDEAVTVSYSLPIVFQVVGKKLSRKENRALKKLERDISN